MKKPLKLVVGVAILFLFILSYFLVKNGTAKAAEKEEEESDTTIAIADISSDDITAISFVSLDGTTLSFSMNDGTWQYDEDTEFPLNTELLVSMSTSFANLKANRQLDGVEDLAEYGLESPKTTIVLTLNDDTTKTFTIGNSNGTTGDSYMYMDDDNSVVYTVGSSLYSAFSYNLNGLANSEDFPVISSSAISKIQVTGENSYSLYTSDDSATGWYYENGTSSKMEAYSDTVNTILSSVSALTFGTLKDYNCEDLSQYGLDDSAKKITVNYTETVTNSDTDVNSEEDTEEDAEEDTEEDTEESTTSTVDKTMTLYIGSQDENENYYVRVDGSNQIHTMSASSLDEIIGKEKASFDNLALGVVSIDEIDKVEITYQDKRYTFTKKEEEETDEDGTASTTVKYYLDDEVIDTSKFTALYYQIMDTTADSKSEESIDINDPELSITFYKTDGTTRSLEMMKYDSSFYVSRNQDFDELLINKMNVREIISQIKSAVGLESEE